MLKWVDEFEKKSRGTIVTTGKFCGYITNHKLIIRIFEYVLKISNETIDEKTYLTEMQSQLIYTLENNELKISILDTKLVNEFLITILNKTKDFIYINIQPSDRAIFYVLMQNKFEIENIQGMFGVAQNDLNTIKNELLAIHKTIHTQTWTSLSDEWFTRQNREQIKNLGNRYIPDLNISTETSKVFDGLAKNDDFYHRFKDKSDNAIVKIKSLHIDGLKCLIDKVTEVMTIFLADKDTHLDISTIRLLLEDIFSILNKEMIDLNSKINQDRNSSGLRDKLYSVREAYSSVEEYIEYLDSPEVRAVNQPYILIDGEGGIGKSHLLADAIERRIANNNKSLLFLGQHFKGYVPPLNEMISFLGVKLEVDSFLEQINSIAQEQQSRIIIFIDALNEGNGKSIWKNYLAGIIEKIKKFQWIGLVITIRSEYTEILLNGSEDLRNELVMITHSGFKSLEYIAVKKYFEFYGIVFSDVPFANHEFGNPLFLRLFCEGHRNHSINIDEISLSEVFNNYLEAINQRIAENCGYNHRYKVIREVINEIIKYKYEKGSGGNFIPLQDMFEVILKIQNKYNCQSDLLEQLLSEGVLTQNINYEDEEYLFITYEKLEDYLYSKILIQELQNDIKVFAKKYARLIHYRDILGCLAICATEDTDYEIFDIFAPEHEAVKCAFIESLKWRSSNSVNEKTINYINKYIMKGNSNIFEQFIETLILVSTKSEFVFNADMTVDFILGISMPDRDALFIPMFDIFFDNQGSSINRILDWCLSTKVNYKISDDAIRLAALMISIFLISSNRHLRDKSTKAMVALLEGHVEILIQVLQKFRDVDDPYVAERLYAVAFGCSVSETNNSQLTLLAKYVYKAIFNREFVYPNILLRDYAKNIIDYAEYRLSELDIDMTKVTPPYKSIFPNIPSDDEVKKYKYDHKDKGFKDYYWGQNSILSSMKVEYSRDGSPGGYGDFGRYTFQSYFSNWKQLDPMDLKNIAIKKIFDLGYDAEKHGQYDRHRGSGRTINNTKERIGKKYQWIAFFELAAQVSDNYKMQIYVDARGTKNKVYCKGSFEPNVRNIDPTISLTKTERSSCKKSVHQQLYKIPKQEHSEWLKKFNDLPDIEKLMNIHYNSRDFILLNGQYSWTEEKALGDKKYQNPLKNMWVQVNSYIVKKEQLDELITKLSDADFMGRWMPEPRDYHQLYNKEYYWSEGYSFFENPYYCGEEWVDIDNFREKKYANLGKVLIPTFKYLTERDGDTLGEESSCMWYKPCGELFNCLKMKYGKEDSILYDQNNLIICFDSMELLNEDIGFFIDKNRLFEYLNESGYSIFWTILGEKGIITDNFSSQKSYSMPHISGMFYLNEIGKLIGKRKQIND